MIAKEKAIFWILLFLLVATIAIGINAQEKKRQSSDAFLKDIESVTEKARAKKKMAKDNWNVEGLKKKEIIEDYSNLMERSIFFRPVSEVKDEGEADVIPLKEEEPKKPMFIYKGRMMLGTKVIVIIEDQNTGKSFSVKEGDMAGDCAVLSIDEKEIRLKKKDGEEILIPTVKEVGDGLKPSPTNKDAEGINEKK
jgi:hypothetical protein